MKTISSLFGIIAFSMFGVVKVQAETYDGVHAVHSQFTRAEVSADARMATRDGNVFGNSWMGGVTPARDLRLGRASVRGEAIEATRAGNVYGDEASAGMQSGSNG